MIRLSEGIVTDALETLYYFQENGEGSKAALLECCHSRSASQKAILQFIHDISWVITLEGCLRIADNALMHIIRYKNESLSMGLWRDIIQDYIAAEQPNWVTLAIYGRTEATIAMSADEIHCLTIAGLFISPPSSDVVQWWDSLANETRVKHGIAVTNTGRTGEELSFRYETQRVHQTPIWQSIESNLSGYDLISINSSTDSHRLLIEVKSTTDHIDFARFHISRNEWNYAKDAKEGSYVFHLWLLSQNPMLAVISKERIADHIPFDSGSGKWESVEIPFVLFQDAFVPIDFMD